MRVAECSGYVAGPDGHLWEVAHNPYWPLDESGQSGLPVLPEVTRMGRVELPVAREGRRRRH